MLRLSRATFRQAPVRQLLSLRDTPVTPERLGEVGEQLIWVSEFRSILVCPIQKTKDARSLNFGNCRQLYHHRAPFLFLSGDLRAPVRLALAWPLVQRSHAFAHEIGRSLISGILAQKQNFVGFQEIQIRSYSRNQRFILRQPQLRVSERIGYVVIIVSRSRIVISEQSELDEPRQPLWLAQTGSSSVFQNMYYLARGAPAGYRFNRPITTRTRNKRMRASIFVLKQPLVCSAPIFGCFRSEPVKRCVADVLFFVSMFLESSNVRKNTRMKRDPSKTVVVQKMCDFA